MYKNVGNEMYIFIALEVYKLVDLLYILVIVCVHCVLFIVHKCACSILI